MLMFGQLMKGLAKRGHQVDVISTVPQKKPYPNYTDIIIPSTLPILVNNFSYSFFQEIKKDSWVYIFSTKGNDACEKALEYPEFQRIIKNPPKDQPYDLVITELTAVNCFLAFGHHLKVPVIGLSSSPLSSYGNVIVANPENLAFIPENLLEYTGDMTFWMRLYNVVYSFYVREVFKYYTSSQNQVIKKHFGPDAPDIRKLERDIALVIVNSHFTTNEAKPTTPAIIEVGGIHIYDDGSEIPVADKKWLDESEHGFIYFTLGSMFTIESFFESMLVDLYESFWKIAPVRIFMKVSNIELLPPGLPENVRIFSWMPQLKVLKHKNIRAFITHGGLMSGMEAISCAVPMIGIPLFADQSSNIRSFVKQKIAINLNYHDLTEAKLNEALNEILYNPIYSEMVKKVSKRFLDRPISPMDEACYWVEYIIRHGNKALRSPALDFSWWQIALLDVYLTLFIAAIIVAFRILGIFPLNGRSHMMMFEQLMKGLAKRGHQVDVVSTFPLKKPHPNYTDIVIPAATQSLINNISYNHIQTFLRSNVVHFMTTQLGNKFCEKGLAFSEIQKLIKNPPTNPPYDLVITEIFTAHCFMAFGPHLKVPVIGISSSVLYPWSNDFIANPENLAFSSNNLLSYMKNMNFWNRFYNVIHNIYNKMLFNYYTSSQSDLIKKHFGPNALTVRELERDLALILANSHFSLNGAKPTTPALVEVAGLHIQDDDSEIPANHKKWLDESKDGFIYFTFGSMVTIESFPVQTLENLYNSFRKIAPIRIFMKVPQPKLLPPGLPKNVRTFIWISQLKVLKHKNIRAFITHGGLMSTQEAIFCAVPIIGVPLYADQFLNIDLYVTHKIALRLDYDDLTEDKLDAALIEILENPIY
ncbi:hypothetical protein PV326_008802, partial [Microctonus aethiopoides]